MNSLPLEILSNIFLYLDLRQKIRCMLVSRYWANVIKASGLLETVDICSLDALKSFIRRLLVEPTQRLQVKHLTVCNDDYNYFCSSQLCNLLPNLKTIYLKHAPGRHSYYTIEEIEPLKGMDSLRDQMSDIIDFGDCDFTHHLLSSGICSQLTTLTLDLEDSYRITKKTISLLKNSPNLLKLTMHNAKFTLHDLECLLNYLSRLQSLTIEYAQIYKSRSNSIYPIVITPSPSVKNLAISVVDMDWHLEYFLLNYIKRKLSCLEDVALWESGEMKFKRSARYTIVWLENELPYWRENEENEQDEVDREVIYDGPAWIPFVQHYGYRLKSLGLLSLADEPGLLTAIDQAGCRLEKLSLYNARNVQIFNLLNQSKQCTYIKELVLLNIDDELSLEPIKYMTCLTKLNMAFIDLGCLMLVHFNLLLDLCGNRLTHLALSNVRLKFLFNTDQQYGLKKLELDTSNLPNGFGLFLSHHFQRLRYLTLRGSIPLQMSLDLPKLHLSCFNLKTPASEGHIYFSVVSLADKSCHSYAFCHRDKNYEYLDSLTETYGAKVCTTMPPTCLDLLNQKRSFVLVCASVQNVILNNILAC